MAGFDFLGGMLGQRDIPEYRAVSPEQKVAAMRGSVGPLADVNIAWNNRLAPAYARNSNVVEDIYDPTQRPLREATSKSILDELNLGGSLSQDDQDMVIQKALQGNVASGFGVSPGGRGLVARDLGLRAQDLRDKRIGTAANYTLATPKGYQMYQPQTITDPTDVANWMSEDAANENSYNTFSSLLQSQNDKNAAGGILGMAGSIFGGIGGMTGGGTGGGGIGGIMGGGGGGGAAAGGIGGSGGQGGFGGLFGGLFGGGGTPSSVKAGTVTDAEFNNEAYPPEGVSAGSVGGGAGMDYMSMFGGGGGGMGGGGGTEGDWMSRLGDMGGGSSGGGGSQGDENEGAGYGALVGSLLGTAVGAYYGGPQGAQMGNNYGGKLGSWAGGLFG